MKLKTSREASFLQHDSYVSTDRLCNVRTKLKCLIDYSNVTEAFEMVSNSKHRQKNKQQRYRRTNNENTERRKPSFTHELVENTDVHKPTLNKIMTTHK